MEWIALAKKHLSEREPIFGWMIAKDAAIPFSVPKRIDLFGSLAHAIVNQQLSGRVADVIFGRVRALFPRKRLDPKVFVKMPDAKLRAAGLSFGKIKSLKDLADHINRGKLPGASALAQLSDEAIIEALTQVHGIGPWTVHMLLIFKLGRPNVFPSADLGIQKGFQKLFRKRRLPTAKFLEAHSRRWDPYRTLAAWYLWRAVDEAVVVPAADHRS